MCYLRSVEEWHLGPSLYPDIRRYLVIPFLLHFFRVSMKLQELYLLCPMVLAKVCK